MKKKLLVFLMLFLCMIPVLAASFIENDEVNFYDSDEMISAFFKEKDVSDSSYWDRVNIYLVSVDKGSKLYSTFGHSAIMVDIDGMKVMYHWGSFRFNKQFYWNFIKGNLWYRCVGVYADYEFEKYKNQDREVRVEKLELSNSKKQALVDFLYTNTSTPYNEYEYHYFYDNCATRIRDLINVLYDREFEKYTKSLNSYTYRQILNSSLGNKLWITFVFDCLLGPVGDEEITVWDACFMPSILEGAVKKNIEQDKPFDYRILALIVGLILGIISFKLCSKNSALYSAYSFLINLVFGFIGLALFVMMIFTKHDVSYWNLNVFFINPTLLATASISIRFRKHSTFLKKYYIFNVIVCAFISLMKVAFPQNFIQEFWPQMLVFMPYYALSCVGFLVREDRFGRS